MCSHTNTCRSRADHRCAANTRDMCYTRVSFNMDMKLVIKSVFPSNCFILRAFFLFQLAQICSALLRLSKHQQGFFSVQEAGRLSDQCRRFSLLECRFYQHVLSRRQTEGSPRSAKVDGQTVTKSQSPVLHTVSPWQLS